MAIAVLLRLNKLKLKREDPILVFSEYNSIHSPSHLFFFNSFSFPALHTSDLVMITLFPDHEFPASFQCFVDSFRSSFMHKTFFLVTYCFLHWTCIFRTFMLLFVKGYRDFLLQFWIPPWMRYCRFFLQCQYCNIFDSCWRKIFLDWNNYRLKTNSGSAPIVFKHWINAKSIGLNDSTIKEWIGRKFFDILPFFYYQ